MLLTLLSMGAAIALIPLSAHAIPSGPPDQNMGGRLNSRPIPSVLSAKDYVESETLNIISAPQTRSRAISRETELDYLPQGIFTQSDRRKIASDLSENFISRRPPTKSVREPREF